MGRNVDGCEREGEGGKRGGGRWYECLFVDGEMVMKVSATHGGWRYSLQLLEKKATATCGIAG